jgi:hypothetical protein
VLALLRNRHRFLRVVEALLGQLDHLGLLQRHILAIVFQHNGGIVAFVVFGLFLTLFALFLLLLGFLTFQRFLPFRFLALDFLGLVDKSAKIRERRCAIGWLHCCVTCHVLCLCG